MNPTSGLTLLILVVIGFAPLKAVITSWLPSPWLAYPLAALAGAALVLILAGLIHLIKISLRPLPAMCHECGQALTETRQRVRYLYPTFQELILVVLYLAAVYGLIILSRYLARG